MINAWSVARKILESNASSRSGTGDTVSKWPNTGQLSKFIFIDVFPSYQKVFFWKWCKLFKFFLKRRLTRFWWITEKYCKSEKFQIGHKSIMPYWKLFGLAIFFFLQKRVRRLLKKRLNSLHYITWLFFELFQQTLVADF